MPKIFRNLLFTVAFFQLIQGIAIAKQVYLRDGSSIDCQSFWRHDGKIFVKINRDILLNFGCEEVDLTKTLHLHHKKSALAHKNRVGGGVSFRADLLAKEPDGILGRKSMASSVRRTLLEGNFGALEEIANRYRSKKARTLNGWWKLSVFYDAFKLQGEDGSEADWNTLFTALKRWGQKYPESPTAKVALATAWFDYGSQARGGQYAKDVSNEGWKLFLGRLQKSREAVAGVKKAAGYPDVLMIKLRLEAFLGNSRKAYYDQFYRAVTMEPAYHDFYSEALRFAEKKWGGNPGEWVEVWERINRIAPKNEAIAARCALNDYQEEWFRFDSNKRPEPPKPKPGDKVAEDFYRIKKNMPHRDPYKNGTLHWDAMKASLKQFPNSPYNDNLIAIYACIAKDKELGTVQWKKIGTVPYLSAWKNWGIDPVECRNATNLPKVEGFTDSKESHYMKDRLNAYRGK